MARFYTNENMPLPVALELRKLGHDVLTVAESGYAGISLPDDKVLEFASRESRILITLNRRHFVGLHSITHNHHGIIVCTFDPDFSGQAIAINNAVKRCENMCGKLLRVNKPQV